MDQSQISSDLNNIVQTQVLENNANISASQTVFDYFFNASFSIKLIMLILLGASVWSWAVSISKYMRLKFVAKQTKNFEHRFWSGVPLDILVNEVRDTNHSPLADMFFAGMSEYQRTIKKNLNDQITNISRSMNIEIMRTESHLSQNMSLLSFIGTNGIIVGLLGTVIGITNVISNTQLTSAKDITPHLSEALFTTALGLFAAIPAAFFYNYFQSAINSYLGNMETFSAEFISIISRQTNEK